MHKHTEVGRNAIRTTWTDNQMLQHAPVLNIVPKESKPAVKAAGMMQAELVCYSPCIAQMPVMDWFVIVFGFTMPYPLQPICTALLQHRVAFG